jgi:thymidine phosphorylase
VEAAEMLCMVEPGAQQADAVGRARSALSSGAALERFQRLVEAQGGDPRVVEDASRIARAAERAEVAAEEEGIVAEVDPRALGMGVVALGGGRTRIEDAIDPAVGFEVDVAPGDHVAPGDPMGTVHARNAHDLEVGVRILRGAIRLGEAPSPRPLVSHRIGPSDL